MDDALDRQQAGERSPASTPDGDSLVEVGERATLCDAIDRLLNRGAAIAGDVVISVADVDLVYLDLRLLLTSVETMRERRSRPTATDPQDATPGSTHE